MPNMWRLHVMVLAAYAVAACGVVWAARQPAPVGAHLTTGVSVDRPRIE